MKLFKQTILMISAVVFTTILFQNCNTQKFGVLNQGSTSDQKDAASQIPVSLGNSAVVNPLQAMPAAVQVQGAVNASTTSAPAPVVINVPNAQTPVNTGGGTSTSAAANPNVIRNKIVTATNGCGSFDSTDQRVVEYQLGSGECNNSVSNFVVTANLASLTEAFICFYKADQIETSTNPAPRKCQLIQPMTRNPQGKFVWWSSTFWAFEGIDFTDYKVEVYANRAMTSLVGSIQVGLRFPELKPGHRFFTQDYHDSNAHTGWASSSGNLVFFPACDGSQRSGWRAYAYPVRLSGFHNYDVSNCGYKIMTKESIGAAATGTKSCVFAGGKQPGYPCDFAPARADHTKSATAISRSGGNGSISGTCNNSEWKDVVISCTPVVNTPAPVVNNPTTCTFDGRVAGHSCVFQATTAVSGDTKTAQAVLGGIGSVTATCVGTEWKNVVVNCTPKDSCVFAGGVIEGCRGSFSAATGVHNAVVTSVGVFNNATSGSVTARCDNGNWVNLQPNCQ